MTYEGFQIFFFFLRADSDSKGSATFTGKRCNLGGEGLQVPCKIRAEGQKKMLNILKAEMIKLKEFNTLFTLLLFYFSFEFDRSSSYLYRNCLKGNKKVVREAIVQVI